MKKLLLTGGSGLLATNWALLKRESFEVTLGMHERDIKLKGTSIFKLQLDSLKKLDEDIMKIKPDVIVHTAALSNVELCEENISHSVLSNVELGCNIATICVQRGIQMVHISTDHLFNGETPLVNELSDLNPLNNYAKSKALAEQRILEIYPKVLIIRTNFFGWGTNYRKSFSDFIIENLRKDKKIKLFSDVYFTPILISELVRVVHLLLEQKASGIFHVCGNERISKFEFGMLIAKVFELKLKNIEPDLILKRTELVQRPMDMSLCNHKITKEFLIPIQNLNNQLFDLNKQEQNGIASELQSININS